MEKVQPNIISVRVNVRAPIRFVWDYWTKTEHIINWNNASEDWFTPFAENNLQVGGVFLYRMEAKDGSFGFDFSGKYNQIILNHQIDYTLDDGRKVNIMFFSHDDFTEVVETFEAENMNSLELQQMGWQAILNNFKKYTESSIIDI